MKKFVSIMIAVVMMATASVSLLGQAAQTGDKLASGNYIVYARSPQVWRFIVDAKTMANATVTGRYSITTGTPKDIEAFVFNDENFKKWRSEEAATKSTAKPLYASGRKAEDTINVKLEPGIYYLVFSNLYQYEGTKALTADVRLQYDKR